MHVGIIIKSFGTFTDFIYVMQNNGRVDLILILEYYFNNYYVGHQMLSISTFHCCRPV